MNETADKDPSSETTQITPPVFILGILPRSGTNYLSNLLILHPDCGPPDPIWEDFLVAHSDLLAQYSDSVTGHWDKKWGIGEEARAELDTALGQGLTSFLSRRSMGICLITKTPSVDNLDLFFRFFPQARLLILIRDGRAIIESAYYSFGWRRESTLHALASAARTINNFDQRNRGSGARYKIVRYEDLWDAVDEQLLKLFSFLELKPDVYDFGQAHELPVKGSSGVVKDHGQAMHWNPVEKNDKFDPLSRYSHWGVFRHYRYNRVAGQHMEALGYPCIKAGGPPWFWWLCCLPLDAAWLLSRLARPLYKRLRRR
jgi:protein-tyrosine sulfotransferase